MTGLRVAVTGATGNVGTAVVRALAGDPAVGEVVGIARRLPDVDAPKVRWVSADVRDGDLDAAFAGADAVVHLAWLIQPSRDRATTQATNVEGSRRVFAAAARAGARTLVHASSLAAYGPGPDDGRGVDETWPTTGIRTSFYSREKVAAEDELDRFEQAHPEVRTVRLRPAPVVQRSAAQELRRYFFGPFLPTRLVAPRRTPIGPAPLGLRFQLVHADDLGDAFRRVVLDDDARGAYNVAAGVVIGPRELAAAVGVVPVPLPRAVLRAAAAITWRARLQPTPEGWVDLAYDAPIMDTHRLRALGWSTTVDGLEALEEVLGGIHDRTGGATPPLHPGAGGPLRLDELRTGIGGQDGTDRR